MPGMSRTNTVNLFSLVADDVKPRAVSFRRQMGDCMDWLNISFVDEDITSSNDDETDVNNNTDKNVNIGVEETNDGQKTGPKPAKSYSCTLCKYSTRSRGNFYRHKQAIHKKKKLQCNKCTKEFSQMYDLNQHKKSVHENIKLLCEICSKIFNTRNSLRRHRLKMHSDECKYKCAICSKKFTERNHYLGHLNNHVNAKPYSCQVCKKGFAFKSSSQRHMLSCGNHTKQYTCSICGNTLKTQSSLKSHMKGAHGNRDQLCKCGKAFSWPCALSRHQKRCRMSK